jgi:hypothetical protein
LETGVDGSWTLLIHEDDTKLTGSLTDGEVQVPLSRIELDGTALTFRFYVNERPYTFEGTIDGITLEGKHNGAEASGKLTCAKPKS